MTYTGPPLGVWHEINWFTLNPYFFGVKIVISDASKNQYFSTTKFLNEITCLVRRSETDSKDAGSS